MARGITTLLAAALLSLSPVTAAPAGISNILARADDIKAEYDYVVVGGGTAGLTVADRLTESGRYTVLVIELGLFRNESAVTTVARGYQAILDPSLSFIFPSVPQTGLNGRTIDVWGGVMLGGSSGHNGLQVIRGQKEDYDRWAAYFPRSSGWGWDGLLPYFKKAWNFHPPPANTVRQFDIKYDPRWWGNSGNIHASFPTDNYPQLKVEMDAWKDIPGANFPPDSGAGQAGAYWYPASVDPRVLRSFSRTGHWDGIEAARRNYDTLVGHRVIKINFQNKTATGVTFTGANATSTAGSKNVKAKKEVIVALGTIHTPPLLQASGIGAKSLLQRANINLVSDLPGVGSNLQDHAWRIGLQFNYSSLPFHPDADDLDNNATFKAEQEAQFARNRTGFLTIASGNAAGFIPLPVIAPTAFAGIASRYESQDAAAYLPAGIDATVVAGYKAQKAALARAMRSTGSAWYNNFHRGGHFAGGTIFLHPLSRGTVTLNLANPYFARPAVDYRALTNPADLDVLYEFNHFTRRFYTQTRLARFNPVELPPYANLTTNAQLETAIRANLNPSSFHPVGTAAMLPRELGGVVDDKLLVYGVSRLSVVDASVIPDLPGAYTQQTVFAIAEKAADLIKARA